MFYDDRRMAGLCLFAGGATFLIFHIVAEAVDPAYSVSTNAISDLGVRAGAPFFNSAMVVLGLLLLGAAYFLNRTSGDRIFVILVLVSGVGAMGVGIFNENAPDPLHTAFSLVTFLGIAFTAIASYRVSKPPLAYVGILAGVTSLIALALLGSGTYLGIGFGGMERMIVLPVLAWSLAFGGSLMAPTPAPAPA